MSRATDGNTGAAFDRAALFRLVMAATRPFRATSANLPDK